MATTRGTSSAAGWSFAQLQTNFAGDDVFLALARKAPDDKTYLAAIGLWAIELATAWRSDDGRVNGEPSAFDCGPELEELLTSAGVIVDGRLRGFEKHTERARTTRDHARERMRSRRPK